MTVTAFAITDDRVQWIDFCTFPAWQESYRLVVPRPSERLRLFTFVRPFDNMVTDFAYNRFEKRYSLAASIQVWMLLGATVITAILVMSYLSWAEQSLLFQSMKRKNSLAQDKSFMYYVGSYSLYTLNVLTNHGNAVRPSM